MLTGKIADRMGRWYIFLNFNPKNKILKINVLTKGPQF